MAGAVELRLRCIECGSRLGSFGKGTRIYKCPSCSRVYEGENGTIDFIGNDTPDDARQSSCDQLSIFSEPPGMSLGAETQGLLWQAVYPLMSHQSPGASLCLDVGCEYGGLLPSMVSEYDLVVGVNIDSAEL